MNINNLMKINNKEYRNMWRWSGTAAIGLALVLSACAGDISDDAAAAEVQSVSEEGAQSEAPDTTTPDTPDTTTPDVEETTTTTQPAVPAVFVADAQPLIPWFTAFEPGTYWSAALGTPMSFTTTELLTTQPNGRGLFVISDPNSRGPGDQDIVFHRAVGFADPAEPNAPRDAIPLWPADDFLGWLDNLNDGVIASEPRTTMVGGFDAVQVDLELGDIECGFEPGSCIGFASNGNGDIKGLNPGDQYRVWVIEQGDDDPIVVTVGIVDESDTEWFSRADAVLATLAFGEVRENPVQPIGTETTQSLALGGIELSTPDDRMIGTNWVGRGFYWVGVFEDYASIVSFLERPLTLDLEPITSAEQILGALEEFDAEVIELAPTTIGGIDARVFDFTAPRNSIALLSHETDALDPSLGWDLTEVGRFWVVDHPDRGIQLISINTFENTEEFFEPALAYAEQVVASISYAEVG